MASRMGRDCFFAEQALPVEMKKPFELKALTITCPGMPANAACSTHGENLSRIVSLVLEWGISVQHGKLINLLMKSSVYADDKEACKVEDQLMVGE